MVLSLVSQPPDDALAAPEPEVTRQEEYRSSTIIHPVDDAILLDEHPAGLFQGECR